MIAGVGANRVLDMSGVSQYKVKRDRLLNLSEIINDRRGIHSADIEQSLSFGCTSHRMSSMVLHLSSG